MKTVLAAAGGTVTVVFAVVFTWVVIQERRQRQLATALDWIEQQEQDRAIARKFGAG